MNAEKEHISRICSFFALVYLRQRIAASKSVVLFACGKFTPDGFLSEAAHVRYNFS